MLARALGTGKRGRARRGPAVLLPLRPSRAHIARMDRSWERGGDPLRVLGERPWLVLGGGGLKGLAHVGVWRRLHEAGARPAGVAGCSIGAVVGACIALGFDAAEMERRARLLRRADILRLNRRAAWINGIRAPSVFRGRALRRYVGGLVGSRGWDDLRIPLQVNAVDLATGRTAWFGPGGRTDVALADALYASAALPVLFPPFEAGGALFVDGGLDQVLPAERARALGATGVLLAAVGGNGATDAGALVRGGMVALHQRALGVTIHRRRRQLARRALADPAPAILVEPGLAEYGAFDFAAIPRFIDAGRETLDKAMRAHAAGG